MLLGMSAQLDSGGRVRSVRAGSYPVELPLVLAARMCGSAAIPGERARASASLQVRARVPSMRVLGKPVLCSLTQSSVSAAWRPKCPRSVVG